MDFDSYVRASGPRLLRLAWLLTGDATAAEDLLQTAYTKALPRWERISGFDDPDAYVRRIMINTKTSIWRRARHETVVPALPDSAAPDALGAVEEMDRLGRALASLGAKQRAVVVLRYYLDLSEQEVAANLGVSIGTVKSQAARGLARLHAFMTDGNEVRR